MVSLFSLKYLEDKYFYLKESSPTYHVLAILSCEMDNSAET